MSEGTTYTPEEFTAIFTEMVREASQALFATLQGHQVEPNGEAMDSAGVVGFAGEDIKGLFAVAITGEGPEHNTPEMLKDFAAELANQLAGRVKNQLCRKGVVYDVNPPTILGKEELVAAVRGASTQLTFKRPTATYVVRAVFNFPRPIQFLRASPAQESMNEGDMILF